MISTFAYVYISITVPYLTLALMGLNECSGFSRFYSKDIIKLVAGIV